MIIRRADDRFHSNFGWLDSRHTFSFGHHYDPEFAGFGTLRVINDDTVDGGHGFGAHPHMDMEIISYVLEGAMEHKDSAGNQSVVRPGEVQRMSAGTGIRHSEYNHSETEPVHFLQIWIEPQRKGLEPGYQQQAFSEEERRGRLRLLGSPDGRDGSVLIHQDAFLYGGRFEPGESAKHTLVNSRRAWLQVARGSVSVNGHALQAGDGAGFEAAGGIEVAGTDGGGEVLLFDLA